MALCKKNYSASPSLALKQELTRDQNHPLEKLEIRVKVCQEKLKHGNLMTKRLSSNELTSLLASYFEEFIEAEKEYQEKIL